MRPATSDSDLPTELAALYRLADGQDSPWRTDIPGATDLFPCSQFLSLAEAKDLGEAGLAEYLVALAEYPLEITDFVGEFTWDAPRLR